MLEKRDKDIASPPDKGARCRHCDATQPYGKVCPPVLAYHGAMFRFAPLLRALLCLILLVNGTTYAHAATGMAADGRAVAKQAAQHDDPPCHESMDLGDHDPAGTGDHNPLPDCCASGSCDGACTLHAPVLLWPMTLQALTLMQAEAPAYRADVHASAPLPHRHRPPILVA